MRAARRVRPVARAASMPTVNLPLGWHRDVHPQREPSAPSATGTLVNTATVAVPAGVTDPAAGNNSATDTDTINASADLSITKTDGSATYTPGTSDHVHDRREQCGSEQRERRDGGRHAAGDDHGRDLDGRRMRAARRVRPVARAASMRRSTCLRVAPRHSRSPARSAPARPEPWSTPRRSRLPPASPIRPEATTARPTPTRSTRAPTCRSPRPTAARRTRRASRSRTRSSRAMPVRAT